MPLLDPEVDSIVQQHRESGESRTLILQDLRNKVAHQGSPTEPSLLHFFSSQDYAVLDADRMHQKKWIKKQLLSEILEEARFVLSHALRYGKVLVVRMGDIAVDFRDIFHDLACPTRVQNNRYPPYQPWEYLPYEFMLHNGEKLCTQPPYPDVLYRREDLREIADGDCVRVGEAFSVIITTSIPTEQFHPMLFNGKHGLPGAVEDYVVVTLH